MINKTYGFGIIGCGFIAEHHTLSIKHAGARLVGVTDVSEERAKGFALKHGAMHFKTIEEMLSSDAVDIVCICTPSGFHKENALQAIRAKKHVLVEKPLALTLDDCDLLVEEAKKYKVTAAVVSQSRFFPVSQILRSVVKENRLGRIVTADLTMKYYRSEEYYKVSPWRGTWKHDGGGALMNQGIHGIDLLLSVMGEVKFVHGLTRTLARNIETEDTVAAVLEYGNGALGLIQGTTSVYPGYPRNFVVSGTKGTVGVTENAFSEWKIEDEDIPDGITICKARNSGAATPENINFEEHIPQINDMIEAVRDNRPPISSFEDGRRAVELITAIYQSSKTGKTVYLK